MDRALQRSRTIERSPLPYPWVVLAAATLGLVMTTPGQTVGVSVFLDRIIADLGVDRSVVSLLYTLGTLTASFALPFVGRFIDRRGPRLAVTLISAGLALACVYMGSVRSLAGLALGFVLLRGLGQGSLSLASLHVVNVWFVRRRGLAVGLMGLGTAAATALFPVLIERWADAYGWRAAYPMLGGLVAVTILPLGALLFRGHPERFGRRPDDGAAFATPGPEADPQAEAARAAEEGTAPGPSAASAVPREPEPEFDARAARRTGAFWLFAAGDMAIAALSTALVFHHFDVLASNGVEREAAARMFASFGIATAAANFAAGALMDRVPPRALLAAMQAFQVAALLAAAVTAAPLAIVGYGALLGVTQGMKGAISGSVYALLFGRRHIGAIKGTAGTLSVAATAAGPLALSLGRDAFGGYGPILVLLALPPAAIAVVALADLARSRRAGSARP